MKSSVLIVLVVLSVMSVGASAVWMLEPPAKHVVTLKASGADVSNFRWGEGTEASMDVPATAKPD